MQESTTEWEHVAEVSENYTGEAHHIRLSESVEVKDLFGNTRTHTADFIISATTSLGERETYAFPADEDGEVTSWGEVISTGDRLVSQKRTHDWEMVADALAAAAANEGIQA